jgi:hypothetical protein
MTAFAGDFHFLAAGVLAPIAAILLALRYVALARLMGALALLIVHVFLPGAEKRQCS